MKIKLKHILILLFFSSYSCSYQNIQPHNKVTFLFFQNTLLKDSFPGTIKYSIEDLEKIYQLYENDTSLIASLEISINNSDTLIIFDGTILTFEEKRTFRYWGKNIELYKYYYDVEGLVDEEADVIVDYNYGLVCVYYFPWDMYLFPEIESEEIKYKNFLLDSTNIDFFDLRLYSISDTVPH